MSATPSPAPPDSTHARWGLWRARLRAPVAIVTPVALLALALIGGGTVWEALLAAAIGFAVVAVIAWRRATREARDAFFSGYAGSRRLLAADLDGLPAAVPLLQLGESRRLTRAMQGVLPGGLEGVLAHYAYRQGGDAAGRGDPAVVRPFTLVVSDLPEVTDRVVELHCRRRSQPASHAGLEGLRRQQLESVALDQRYEILCGPAEDELWLRRLFSPSFIVWLAEHSPEGFAFQLSHGQLCGFVFGHLERAADLDLLCETTAVVGKRVLDEVRE